MKVIDIIPITQTGAYANEHYIDGRPCFSPDGNTVLFERKGNGINIQEFWIVDINTNIESVYYKSNTYGCSRASWSWNSKQNKNQIAFTGVFPKGNLPNGRIMLLDENGANNSAQQLTVTGYAKAELFYPAWYANEPKLLVTDYSNQQPKLLKVNINSLQSKELTYKGYWSGMGTVNPVDSDLIAYAGQPITSGGYNQQNNKVYLQNGNNKPIIFSSPAKNVNGRAPWFSSDGRVMAFESQSGKTPLQIFLKRVDLSKPSTPMIPVSNLNFAAQHAKFSPDSSRLVWAQNDGEGRSRIFMGTIVY
ncbi:hypothetical protein [uncultured Kordia sp.]|uniref:TolB family protein n=1 Tax=uncultured Kordia sp. TaxID=507699 RepID=UPI00260CC4D7|nr:hypothetical protein [uncultured Kordia sp.]